MVNQVPKYLKWKRQEDVLKYSRKDLNNNEFGGFFLPLLAAIRKSLLYLENQMMRLDLGCLFNDIIRYNIIINGQNHFHALLIIRLQYFSRKLPSQATGTHTTILLVFARSDRLWTWTGQWTMTGQWRLDKFLLIWYLRWYIFTECYPSQTCLRPHLHNSLPTEWSLSTPVHILRNW